MSSNELLSVIKTEIIGKKNTSAPIDRDQLIMAAAYVHSAFYALFYRVSFPRKFATFSTRAQVITLVDFNFYGFYRQMSFPPLNFYINYTTSYKSFVNNTYNL